MRLPIARAMSLLVAVALLISTITGLFALYTARWRVASLPGTQQVANHTFAEQIIVGEHRTCVTLRRETPATNGSSAVEVKREENCFNTFPTNLWTSRLRDVSTGKKSFFFGVCWVNRTRAARVLGIPEDVPIESLWKRQCYGARTISLIGQSGALAFAFIAGMILIFAVNEEERPWGGTCFVVMLAALLSLVPLVIWFRIIKKPGFEVGAVAPHRSFHLGHPRRECFRSRAHPLIDGTMEPVWPTLLDPLSNSSAPQRPIVRKALVTGLSGF
ncbi:hypothetical protein PINS_up012534 [Pythium insidiosum]|nr:hypothetical protein PINS_up012534 [Pythium insidiosum]